MPYELPGPYPAREEKPPVSPADACWYLQWSEGAKDSAKDRAEKEAANPRLPEFTVEAPVKRADDGKAWSVSVDLLQVKEYKGAMRRIQLAFPKGEGKVNLKRVAFSKK